MSPWLGEDVACTAEDVACYTDAPTEHIIQILLVFLKRFLICSYSSIPLACVTPVLPQGGGVWEVCLTTNPSLTSADPFPESTQTLAR